MSDSDEWVGVLVPYGLKGYQALDYFDGRGERVATYAVSDEFGLRWAGKWLRDALDRRRQRGEVLPRRVRVSSAELAVVLRAAVSEIEIVEAPTPEFAALSAPPGEDGAHEEDTPFEEQRSFYGVDLEDRDVEGLFAAGADLHRAEWWSHVPVVGVVGAFTVLDSSPVTRAVAVLQLAFPPPLLVFEHGDDFASYLAGLRALSAGDEFPTVPVHLHLGFCSAMELSQRSLHELSERGRSWDIAGDDAIPWLARVGRHLDGHVIGRDDARFVALVARALAALLRDDRDALRAAWDGGPSVARDLVLAHDGASIEVRVRVPWVSANGGPVLPIRMDPAKPS